jgi:hypothetical protein
MRANVLFCQPSKSTKTINRLYKGLAHRLFATGTFFAHRPAFGAAVWATGLIFVKKKYGSGPMYLLCRKSLLPKLLTFSNQSFCTFLHKQRSVKL